MGILDKALASESVEIDRVVPASGASWGVWPAVWLGPARAGRTLTLWIDTTTVHLSLDGQHLKTLPSGLINIDLARLRIRVEYLFVDAIFESLRRHGAKEAVLVAWCIASDGRKHLLHLAVGNKDSHGS